MAEYQGNQALMQPPSNEEIAQAAHDMAQWMHQQGHADPLKAMLILCRVFGYLIAHCAQDQDQVEQQVSIAGEQIGEVARFYWDYRHETTQH